jgi:hypothetical protein
VIHCLRAARQNQKVASNGAFRLGGCKGVLGQGAVSTLPWLQHRRRERGGQFEPDLENAPFVLPLALTLNKPGQGSGIEAPCLTKPFLVYNNQGVFGFLVRRPAWVCWALLSNTTSPTLKYVGGVLASEIEASETGCGEECHLFCG